MNSDQNNIEGDNGIRFELPQLRLDLLSRVSRMYIIWLLITIPISYVIYRIDWGSADNATKPAVFFYFVILIVHLIKRLFKGGWFNILAPDIIFVAIYTMFQMAYMLFWVLHLAPYSDWIIFSETSIPRSFLIINLGLTGFIFGFEFFGTWREPRTIATHVESPSNGWGIIGFGLIMVGILMHVGALIGVGIGVFLQNGYTAVARLNEYATGIWPIIWIRSLPVVWLGLTLYIISSSLRYKKLFQSKFVLGATAAIFLLIILEGDRGPLFLMILILILVRHYYVKPFKVRFFVLLAFIILSLFAGMKIVRSRALSPIEMLEEYRYAHHSELRHWSDPFVEAGGTYQIANITAMLVPDNQSYWYGASWLDAIIHTVPFLQGLAFKAGMTAEAPAVWITTEIVGPGGAGLGFSLPAEGYLNFGFPGAFVQMMIFGLFIRRIAIWFSLNPSMFKAFVFLGILAPTIKVIRDHISLVTPLYGQIFILAVILYFLCERQPHYTYKPDEIYRVSY